MQRDINCLSDANRMIRRRTLEKLRREIIEKDPSYSAEDLQSIFDELYRPLLKLYADSVDRNRELALNLVSDLCFRVTDASSYLPYIIPTLSQRLAVPDQLEPTEEIRLMHVESLSSLIELCKDRIGAYIDDLINILQKCILDPFADVRKVSCKCTNLLAKVVPDKFYLQGESLVPALLKSVSHQHNKVRTVVIETIGIVVKSTSGKAVDDAFTHLAQRTFDHSGPVRLMVAEVVGDWLLNLRDRYSFFHKLLPLLLSGLSDELPDVQAKSLLYFQKAGLQYEEENEKDFKEKKEYGIDKHFEDLMIHERPSIGCRALVHRNLSKILPAIVHDITDWNADTRLKSASLLYHMVFYAEDYITMNMELLLQGLYRAAQDENPRVEEKVLETSELVGLFVEPSVYCKLILPHISSVSTSAGKALSSALAILAALIRGANYRLLDPLLKDIGKSLSQPEVCNTLDSLCHKQLVTCASAIVHKSGINHAEVSYDLFKVLIHVASRTQDQKIRDKVHSTMAGLCDMMNHKSLDALYTDHGTQMLQEISTNVKEWSSQSVEYFVYVALLSEANEALPNLLDDAIPIFVQCADTGMDSEMRLRMFTLLSQLLVGSPFIEVIQRKLDPHVITLIRECILPNCVWQAGRVAAAVRSASMSFLWALLQSFVITETHLKDVLSEIIKQIVSCLDDHNETSRLVAIKVVLKLLLVGKSSIHVDCLHTLYIDIMKRMDDSSDEIRVITSKCMAAFFNALPKNYNRDLFKAHLEFIFKTLLVHLDDPSENVKIAVSECLKTGVEVHPGLLKLLAEDVRLKHKSPKYCDDLIKQCDAALARHNDNG